MVERQKRLIQVYEYIRQNYGIHTQIDFAKAIKYSRVYISAALNGNENNLSDNLFENICETYPNTFNLDYLLTGNGSLLKEQVIHDDGLIKITESGIDPSSLVNAALAAKDETIAALRENLEAKDQLIASLRQQIEILKKSNRDQSKDVPMMVADNPKV